MNPKNYIKLPTLQSLKVVNYPLFNYGTSNCWSFEVQDGINMMLGANSIGKTTTVNMIKFAFVGNYEKIGTTYFSERLKRHQRNNKQYIILQFLLNGHLVEIHRNIASGNLDKFTVSGSEKYTSDYQSFVEENSSISLEKLGRLLEFMLIRVEEGNYILWDKNIQTEIMSILLNDVKFQEQFFQDEAKYKKSEEDLRNIDNLIKNQKRREEELRTAITDNKNKKSEHICHSNVNCGCAVVVSSN